MRAERVSGLNGQIDAIVASLDVLGDKHRQFEHNTNSAELQRNRQAVHIEASGNNDGAQNRAAVERHGSAPQQASATIEQQKEPKQ